MPGIAGILAPVPSPAYERRCREMVVMMQHHPAPVSGTAFAAELGVYGGWVAFEGSFAAQEAASAMTDGPLSLLCVGECFGTNPPARVSLKGRYTTQGDTFVAGLNGLFAGLLIDRERPGATVQRPLWQRTAVCIRERRCHLFRQRGQGIACRAARTARIRRHRRRTVSGLRLDNWWPDPLPWTRLVPGGSLWQCAPGAPLQRTRYFTRELGSAASALRRRVRVALRRGLRPICCPHYLRAERPVGLSLTGGLDTRMIVACLPRGEAPARGLHLCRREQRWLLDLWIARRVAALRGVPHHALRVNQQFPRGLRPPLDRTVYVTDGCAGVLGAHELYLSEQARQLAPVRLTGNFGSEVLRSMSTFKRSGPR